MTRTLRIDCFSGISGDMMLGALLDLGVPEEIVQEAINSLGLPGKLTIARIRKAGFAAVQISVETPHEHSHRHLSHIYKILDQGKMTDGARMLARKMFEKLGEAEAASHGIPIEKVHFHEVGAVDSIFDFVGIAVGLDWLKIDRVTSTPVPTGCGWVVCDHGKLPVPAPAVARLLEGVPLADCAIESELTTPTGAAVIATIVSEFSRQPTLTIERAGIGAGSRDLAEQPNVLRLLFGVSSTPSTTPRSDMVWQLETNLDDVPAEILGYTTERLFALGALDAYFVPIQMKKSRPGVLLSVLCNESDRVAIEAEIFRQTGTLGIRRSGVERTKLERKSVEVDTPWGKITGKVGWNDSVRVFSPEFEECAHIAREHSVPLRDVYAAASRAFEGQSEKK